MGGARKSASGESGVTRERAGRERWRAIRGPLTEWERDPAWSGRGAFLHRTSRPPDGGARRGAWRACRATPDFVAEKRGDAGLRQEFGVSGRPAVRIMSSFRVSGEGRPTGSGRWTRACPTRTRRAHSGRGLRGAYRKAARVPAARPECGAPRAWSGRSPPGPPGGPGAPRDPTPVTGRGSRRGRRPTPPEPSREDPRLPLCAAAPALSCGFPRTAARAPSVSTSSPPPVLAGTPPPRSPPRGPRSRRAGAYPGTSGHPPAAGGGTAPGLGAAGGGKGRARAEGRTRKIGWRRTVIAGNFSRFRCDAENARACVAWPGGLLVWPCAGRFPQGSEGLSGAGAGVFPAACFRPNRRSPGMREASDVPQWSRSRQRNRGNSTRRSHLAVAKCQWRPQSSV